MRELQQQLSGGPAQLGQTQVSTFVFCCEVDFPAVARLCIFVVQAAVGSGVSTATSTGAQAQ